MAESIHEKVAVFAAIEAKRHFLQVGRKMFATHVMPCSHDAALQERERGFDGVRVNEAGDIFAAVIDCFVRLPLFRVEAERINRGFIGHDDFDIFAQVLVYDLPDGFRVRVVGVDESQFAVTFADSENDLLFSARTTTASLATDISFINFDRAVHHGLRFLHGRANPMAEIPRGFVGADSERPLNLAGRHTLLRFAEKKSCDEPLFERKMGVMENRSRRRRKLIVAGLAVEDLLFGFEFHGVSIAARAPRSFRPAKPSEQFTALRVGREHGVYVS